MTMAGAGLALTFCLLLLLPGHAAGSLTLIYNLPTSALGYRAPTHTHTQSQIQVQLHTQTRVRCPSQWTAYHDSCYRYYAGPLTYSQAQSACRVRGSRLLEVESDGENRFAVQLIQQYSGNSLATAWMGLTYLPVAGRFVSPFTSTAPTFSRWAPGETNTIGREHCVFLITVHGYWLSKLCTDPLPFVCERNSTAASATTTTTTTTTTPPPQCNTTWCMVQTAQWKSMPIG